MSDNDKPLSRRELLAVQGVIAGKTATAALLEAGYGPSVAEKQQKAVLEKPRVKKAILAALEKAGITDKLLATTMREGLEAQRPAAVEGGKVTEWAPDHSTRHKFAMTALQIRGDLERSTEGEGGTWEEMVIAVRARRAQVASTE